MHQISGGRPTVKHGMTL